MSVKRASSTAGTAIAMAAPKDMVGEEKCQKPILAVQRAKLAAKLPSSCFFEMSVPFIAIFPFPIFALSASLSLVPGQAHGVVPKNCVLPAGSLPLQEGVLLWRLLRHAHGVYP